MWTNDYSSYLESKLKFFNKSEKKEFKNYFIDYSGILQPEEIYQKYIEESLYDNKGNYEKSLDKDYQSTMENIDCIDHNDYEVQQKSYGI